MPDHLKLAHGLAFDDLYEEGGIARIDGLFLDHLGGTGHGEALRDRLVAGRADPGGVEPKAESELLEVLAPHLDRFIGTLFGISAELKDGAARHLALSPVFSCRRLFVQRIALRKYKAPEAAGFDGDALRAQLETHLNAPLTEEGFACAILGWMEEDGAHADALDIAARYAAWAVHGPRKHKSEMFRAPAKLDPFHLVPLESCQVDGVSALAAPEDHLRRRDGFKLTDEGTNLAGALSEASYCIFCHHQGKDSCSKGLKDSKTGAFRKSPFGVDLTGCPLEEKISEMHEVKKDGHIVGALAIAVVDNPMLAATGHRICNDCMKSCIFQKQDPVDIPQAETRILKDVLELPWGFEIYSLLTRWNPLDLGRPVPRKSSGYKVLVVGLGPAGFTLAHHLLNEGHAVVAVDGAKIEPLDAEFSGVTPSGARVPFRAIRDVNELYEPLDDRVMAGFGGVAEYGITVRWNKNFLKLIRLLLERRPGFAMFGGVRFGGTITAQSAYEIGFDHIALCAGAGRPTVLGIPNGLARGVRQASDFLMALQLTGAAKTESIANLQLRLPVVVVGGGLTAIDTATECLAYYVVQVEKFLHRYATLVSEKGEAAVRASWSDGEAAVADEYLAHAKAIGEERKAAGRENREPRIIELLQEWGGATIAYRRRMIDAPSYTLNHEEVDKAMEEGVRFAELLSPKGVVIDSIGQATGLRLAKQEIGEDGRPGPTGEEIVLPAKSILIAAGTRPNTVLVREHEGFATLDGKYFQAIEANGDSVSPETHTKPADPQVLMELNEDGTGMSFFGDLHPSYSGNVVGAMGSAKQGYPVINRTLKRREPSAQPAEELFRRLDDGLRPTVHAINRLTPTIVEVVIRAPFAANAFRPGQFYRLQNFETLATRVGETTLAMEGLALTGAWVDREKGLVSVIVLEMGGSSDLCRLLKPGEPVILMGPTGSPTEISGGETVLLAGGGLGNAVLFSIGQAMREASSKVLYFAAYKALNDRYHTRNIEAAADVVVWCCDEAPGFEPSRPQDAAFAGNIVEAMTAYANGELGDTSISLKDVDRIVVIGSDVMMDAVTQARHGVLKEFLKPGHKAIGSINSPMQCMMKEICAQCLQLLKDPETGEETVVFTCFNQDQPLDHVVFPALRQRLCQNAVQEKLTQQWIARCMAELEAKS